MKSSFFALTLVSAVGASSLVACSSNDPTGSGGAGGGGGSTATSTGDATTSTSGTSTSTSSAGGGGSSSTSGGTGGDGATSTATSSSSSSSSTSSSSGGAQIGTCAAQGDKCSKLSTCTDNANGHTCACPANSSDVNGDGSQCVTRFDLSSVLIHDSIVNNGNGAQDLAQNFVDGDKPNDTTDANDLGTQTYCNANGFGSPKCLPDDAKFAANGDHPALQLYWSNDKDGANSTILNYDGASAQFDRPYGFSLDPIAIPAANYTQLQVFGTGANGDCKVTFTITYESGNDTVVTTTFANWVADAPASDQFRLIGGLDRISFDAIYYNDTKHSMWGFNLSPDSGRKVKSIAIAQVDDPKVKETNSFVFYGVIGW